MRRSSVLDEIEKKPKGTKAPKPTFGRGMKAAKMPKAAKVKAPKAKPPKTAKPAKMVKQLGKRKKRME